MQKKYIIYGLTLCVIVIWSFNVVINRYVIDYISPLSMSFYRWFVALIILTPFLIFRLPAHKTQVIQHLPQLAVLSFLGMFLSQGLAYIAAKYTLATNMGFIHALLPVVTMLMAFLILKTKPSKTNIMGSCICLFGLVYMLQQGNLGHLFGGMLWQGNALMLSAISAYALYCVLLKAWSITLPLWVSLYIQIALVTLYHVPLISLFGLDAWTAENTWCILYAGVLTSAIAPWLWMNSVNHIGPTQTSSFMNLLPIFTACIATLWLDERWTIYHTLGGGLVLLGTLLAQLQAKRSYPSTQTS